MQPHDDRENTLPRAGKQVLVHAKATLKKCLGDQQQKQFHKPSIYFHLRVDRSFKTISLYF